MGKRNWLSLETILTVIMSEKVRATGIKWVEAKDAAKHPPQQRITQPQISTVARWRHGRDSTDPLPP